MEFEVVDSLQDCEEYARSSPTGKTREEKTKLLSGPGGVVFPFSAVMIIIFSLFLGWGYVSIMLRIFAIILGVFGGAMLLLSLLRFGIQRVSVKMARDRYQKMQGEQPRVDIYKVDEQGLSCAAKDGVYRHFYGWQIIERVTETENLVIFTMATGVASYFNKKFLGDELETMFWTCGG